MFVCNVSQMLVLTGWWILFHRFCWIIFYSQVLNIWISSFQGPRPRLTKGDFDSCQTIHPRLSWHNRIQKKVVCGRQHVLALPMWTAATRLWMHAAFSRTSRSDGDLRPIDRVSPSFLKVKCSCRLGCLTAFWRFRDAEDVANVSVVANQMDYNMDYNIVRYPLVNNLVLHCAVTDESYVHWSLLPTQIIASQSYLRWICTA